METPNECVGITCETPSGPKPNKRKAKLRFDGRYALGRRVRDLEGMFRARLGPDAADPIMATAIRQCAETVALSEDLRARMLRGESVSADDVLRTTRAADALTRRLHLDRHAAAKGPTLAEHLANRVGRPVVPPPAPERAPSGPPEEAA